MFAIVRTGGKQYRVAAGDKIAVDRMAGNAGDKVSLGDVLFASDGGEAKAGLTVSAEIVAQAKADKIIVFKKKRRHNYRRKAGHRQQHTILKIVGIGAPEKAKKAEAAPKPEAAPADETKAAKPAKAAAAPKAEKSVPSKAEGPAAEKKPAAKKAAPKAAKPADKE